MALKLPSVKALPPITLEQLAEVTARIDTGTPREEALRDARVPAEMWELAQHTWASLIAEDDAHKKPSLRTRFAELLAEYRTKALHHREHREQQEPPEARGPRQESSPPPKKSVKTSEFPAPPAEIPPTTVPIPPPVPAFPAPPAMVTKPRLSEQEMAAIMAVPETTDGSGTLPIPGQARPDREGAKPPLAPPPAAQDRTPGLVPAEQKRTIALSAMPDLVASPLPPEMLDTGDQPRIKGLVDAEQKRTIALSVVPEPGDDGLPFQAPPAAPQLTLAQYARVCVEMWKAPARGAEICARYGIPDAQAWAAVNQLWQERIHSDPTLQQRWIKLTDRMRTPRTQR